ncbi:hypothetical protein [Gluconacetobacter asukensis]|uniref:Uncharacterized protein n=1 Tax=Gluconacetobacter asukensis TaxID=1017181 RepID=A0A7W4P2K8_9PROT|nr:hypothetical protein [Gluconacetobacter asukensis]MBB2171840.1 hypothetical protein [Gluconacetobacter asukensis]
MIESWPAPAMGKAPRVRASSMPGSLVDLAASGVDMVVWARDVPPVWHETLETCALPDGCITLAGTLDEVTLALRRPDLRRRYPAFLVEDVAQTAALVATLAVCTSLTVMLGDPAAWPGADPLPAARLRALCCYGAGTVDWVSGRVGGCDLVSSISPYALAFVPAWGEAHVAWRFARLRERAVGLEIVAG